MPYTTGETGRRVGQTERKVRIPQEKMDNPRSIERGLRQIERGVNNLPVFGQEDIVFPEPPPDHPGLAYIHIHHNTLEETLDFPFSGTAGLGGTLTSSDVAFPVNISEPGGGTDHPTAQYGLTPWLFEVVVHVSRVGGSIPAVFDPDAAPAFQVRLLQGGGALHTYNGGLVSTGGGGVIIQYTSWWPFFDWSGMTPLSLEVQGGFANWSAASWSVSEASVRIAPIAGAEYFYSDFSSGG